MHNIQNTNSTNTITTGRYITIEGIDGSGKTLLIKMLNDYFKNTDYPVIISKEPGATSFGKNIKQIILSTNFYLDPITEYFLFSADRSYHYETVIKPALQQNKIIISDRSADSSLAYQGYGKHLDIKQLEQINQFSMRQQETHLTIYLKISPQKALQRINARTKQQPDKFENEDFLENVAQGFETIYSKRIQNNPLSCLIIDATEAPQEIFKLAINRILHNINNE